MTLVVFTDLDGTLLDHATYAYGAAEPALQRLKERGIPLVLASSKTASEIATLHAALDLGDTPAIVENGAGLYRPGSIEAASTDYVRIRTALAGTPHAEGFRGFGDMSDAEVAQITGLSEAAARQARMRSFSEPGLWSGSAAERDAFLESLAAQGIFAKQGGRFLTLSFGQTKADRLHDVAHALNATETIALGDAPNDIEMLQAADRGVIVRNDHGAGIETLPGERAGRVIRTDLPGPEGWNAAILHLIDEVAGV